MRPAHGSIMICSVRIESSLYFDISVRSGFKQIALRIMWSFNKLAIPLRFIASHS